jgi:hypothetical protein
MHALACYRPTRLRDRKRQPVAWRVTCPLPQSVPLEALSAAYSSSRFDSRLGGQRITEQKLP